MNPKCPICGAVSGLSIERRIKGNATCSNCGYHAAYCEFLEGTTREKTLYAANLVIAQKNKTIQSLLTRLETQTLITVCGYCFRASCWSGKMRCERSDKNNGARVSLMDLRERNAEDIEHYAPEWYREARAELMT